MWNALGRGELLDIAVYAEPSFIDWFGNNSKPQQTWQKLIWLLLAYNGEDPTPEATMKYQREKLGRSVGQTALLELSALAARNLEVNVERESYRTDRIRKLRDRVAQHKPRFVVFYSTRAEYAEAWNKIADITLHEGVPQRVGETAYVMTYHPQYKRDKAYWITIGDRLRAIMRA